MPRSVLLAFDRNNPDLARIQKDAFENEGWFVHVSLDSNEGLRRADLFKVDVVVATDQLTPIDGIGLCGLLKTIPRTQNIRVVVVSASPKQRLQDARHARADALLDQEVIGPQLVRKVEQLFSPVAA